MIGKVFLAQVCYNGAMFKRINRKVVYQDAWLTLYQDEIEFPNSERGTYAVAVRKNGAFAVVTTPSNEVVLVKQYRYPIEKDEWGIPGGGIDVGEEPETAVLREIQEETGIVGIKNMHKLGEFYALSSFNTEKNSFFHIEIDHTPNFTHDALEQSEAFVERKVFAFSQALEMIDRGEITDSNTVAVLLLLWRRLGEKNSND